MFSVPLWSNPAGTVMATMQSCQTWLGPVQNRSWPQDPPVPQPTRTAQLALSRGRHPPRAKTMQAEPLTGLQCFP